MMPACLTQQLTINASQAATECVGYVLMTGAEYQNLVMVADLFTLPDQSALQGAFMGGFSLPLIAYLVAWAYGQVINFISRS